MKTNWESVCKYVCSTKKGHEAQATGAWLSKASSEIVGGKYIISVKNRIIAEMISRDIDIISEYVSNNFGVQTSIVISKNPVKIEFTGKYESVESVEICEEHGDYLCKVANFGGREYKSRCPKCSEKITAQIKFEEEEKRKAARLERKNSREAELLNILGIPCVPSNFIGVKFECQTNKQLEVKSIALEFAKTFQNRFESGGAHRAHGLQFLGKTGAGKSLLAASIVSAVGKYGFVGQFISAQEIITISRDFAVQKMVISVLSRVDLLAIDEIGMAGRSEYDRGILFQIIDGRIKNNLPTIYTHNFARDNELIDLMGDAMASRINGLTLKVPMPFDDYRIKNGVEIGNSFLRRS